MWIWAASTGEWVYFFLNWNRAQSAGAYLLSLLAYLAIAALAIALSHLKRFLVRRRCDDDTYGLDMDAVDDDDDIAVVTSSSSSSQPNGNTPVEQV